MRVPHVGTLLLSAASLASLVLATNALAAGISPDKTIDLQSPTAHYKPPPPNPTR